MSSGVRSLGFWAALLTALTAAAALALGITTPPRSGPFCSHSCITFPYTDAAAFVPRDYLWMYPAFLLGPLFVVLVICLHHRAPAGRRVFGHVATAFALLAAGALTTNYFIQLTVLQPSLLKGELEHLTLWSQYNPHGLFIALEDVGYLMMGAAFLFAAGTLRRQERRERAVQVLFGTGGVLAIVSLPVLALLYRSDLGYRYEVTVILIDWLVLIVAGVLLARSFRRGPGDEPRGGHPPQFA